MIRNIDLYLFCRTKKGKKPDRQSCTVFRVRVMFEQLCTVKYSQTFADLVPYVFINNSDDSISMTRGASSLEDYF